MELEAVLIARARAEAFRDLLRMIVDTAQVDPTGPVSLDRRVFDEARALMNDDSRYR